MAKVIGGPAENFRGKLEGISFYKMRGVTKTIIRKASGHTKEKVKNDPNLDIVRRETTEFGGRSVFSKYMMQALKLHKPAADHNIAGPLNALVIPLQKMDTTNEYSKRSIRLSTRPQLVKGFSLNREHPFDTVIRYPVTGEIERETASARIVIPELMPAINFFAPVSYPYYALRATLAIVPDIVHTGYGFAPTHDWYHDHMFTYQDTAWFPVLQGSPQQEIQLQYENYPPDGNFTLVAGISIFYGVLKYADLVERMPYAGSAKVLEVG